MNSRDVHKALFYAWGDLDITKQMISSHSIAATLIITICYASLTEAIAAPQAQFIPIDRAYVSAVSADGNVVAGHHNEPFLWTPSTGVEAIPLPARSSLFGVTDLSGDGSTIVGGLFTRTASDSWYEAFRWRRDVGYHRLGRFESDSNDWAFATSVSFDGSVVVGTNDTVNGRRAFRWTENSGSVDLGTLGSSNPIYPPFSEAGGVSNDGRIIVGGVTTTEDHFYKPYRWTETDAFEVIGLPQVESPRGIPAGEADSLSGDGSVIGVFSQLDGSDNWVWTEQAGFTKLPFESPAHSGRIHNISFDGSVIVGRQITWGQPSPGRTNDDAVLWYRTPTGYEIHRIADLLTAAGIDLTGWHLTEAIDVADDGRTIVGVGTAPSGMRRSWYAVVSVPEPTVTILLLMAATCISLQLCRRAVL
jgi:probable HAF family extracellular repeat protein